MLRINEVKLPLDHAEGDIKAAILARLGIPAPLLVSHTIFKRSYDARKKSAIVLIYSLDVVTTDDAAILRNTNSCLHLVCWEVSLTLTDHGIAIAVPPCEEN